MPCISRVGTRQGAGVGASWSPHGEWSTRKSALSSSPENRTPGCLSATGQLDSDPGILVTPGIEWGDSGRLREEHRAGQLPADCPGSQDLNESDSLQVALPTITQKATESAIWKFVRYGRDDVQVLAGLPIGLAIIGMT